MKRRTNLQPCILSKRLALWFGPPPLPPSPPPPPSARTVNATSCALILRMRVQQRSPVAGKQMRLSLQSPTVRERAFTPQRSHEPMHLSGLVESLL